jgi:hypothetical protein
MRGLRGLVAVAAAATAACVAACGGGSAQVFRPAGSLSTPGVQAPLPTPTGERFGGFLFPAGVSIDFASPVPADATRRAVITGYQNYVLSLWAAVLSHGRNTAYQRQNSGNSLGFVRREAAHYRSAAATIKGTISYYDTRIAGIYFGSGADVLSCVDASAFHHVNTRTGATMGPALPTRFTHYLENVAEGRRPDGTWSVNRLAIYPASSTQGAMCR